MLDLIIPFQCSSAKIILKQLFLSILQLKSFHQSERSKYASGFIFTYVGIYGDITTKAINNVNNRGNVKKLHIGHKAKQNRKNARRPITVAVGMAAGANISHLSSTLAISFTQKDRYKNIPMLQATHSNPRFNALDSFVSEQQCKEIGMKIPTIDDEDSRSKPDESFKSLVPPIKPRGLGAIIH
jgi:hypothetical protein